MPQLALISTMVVYTTLAFPLGEPDASRVRMGILRRSGYRLRGVDVSGFPIGYRCVANGSFASPCIIYGSDSLIAHRVLPLGIVPGHIPGVAQLTCSVLIVCKAGRAARKIRAAPSTARHQPIGAGFHTWRRYQSRILSTLSAAFVGCGVAEHSLANYIAPARISLWGHQALSAMTPRCPDCELQYRHWETTGVIVQMPFRVAPVAAAREITGRVIDCLS